MKKDEESLLRMNFLIQAARIYEQSFPEFSSHFVYDFVQMSEKKIIRIDKALKAKIDKRRFRLRKAKHLSAFLERKENEQVECERKDEEANIAKVDI